MRAHTNKDAQKRMWLGEEYIAKRLVYGCSTTIAEAQVDGVPVIVGYVVGRPDLPVPILHYVLTRRRFFRMGICRDLLGPYMDSDQVLYSHKPSIRDLRIPENWFYDPYTALNMLV